ncbi:predicted protein [Histoplasma capsulatum var. duboisii H88]|uniref:Predicted protein n=1 Tax=Ajellomyces capsulatus (strain H88) TaxID=544711 RepID=F0UGL7_AJEC8|nr:predicted protein [Histoplasma capsulatum var. duboisii H88]
MTPAPPRWRSPTRPHSESIKWFFHPPKFLKAGKHHGKATRPLRILKPRVPRSGASQRPQEGASNAVTILFKVRNQHGEWEKVDASKPSDVELEDGNNTVFTTFKEKSISQALSDYITGVNISVRSPGAFGHRTLGTIALQRGDQRPPAPTSQPSQRSMLPSSHRPIIGGLGIS